VAYGRGAPLWCCGENFEKEMEPLKNTWITVLKSSQVVSDVNFELRINSSQISSVWIIRVTSDGVKKL
jgi:hypothetical protein